MDEEAEAPAVELGAFSLSLPATLGYRRRTARCGVNRHTSLPQAAWYPVSREPPILVEHVDRIYLRFKIL